MSFRLFLGRLNAEQSAGYVTLHSPIASADLSRPILLAPPFTQPGIEIVPGPGGAIGQIKVPDGLLDVNVIDQYEYRLECYSPGNFGLTKVNGRYPITGTNFVKWVVKNPVGASSFDKLRISEQRGSVIRDFNYQHSEPYNRWDLLKPDGQTHSVWQVPTGVAAETNYFEEITVGSEVISRTRRTYREDSTFNRRLLTELVEGVDGVLTRTNTYNHSVFGDDGRLEKIEYSDGRWEQVVYDSQGIITRRYEGLGDSAPIASPPADPDAAPAVSCRVTIVSQSQGPNLWETWQRVSISEYSGGAWHLRPVSETTITEVLTPSPSTSVI